MPIFNDLSPTHTPQYLHPSVLSFASAGGPWLVLSAQGITLSETLQSGLGLGISLQGGQNSVAVPAFLGALSSLVLSGVFCLCASLLTICAAYSCCSDAQKETATSTRLRNACVVLTSLALIGASAGLFLPMYVSVNTATTLASLPGVNVAQPGLALAATGLILTFILNMLCFFGRIAGGAVAAEAPSSSRGNTRAQQQGRQQQQQQQDQEQQYHHQQKNLPHQQYSSPATRTTRSPTGRFLPPGWQMRQTNTGDIYYDNVLTGVTQWDRPNY